MENIHVARRAAIVKMYREISKHKTLEEPKDNKRDTFSTMHSFQVLVLEQIISIISFEQCHKKAKKERN